MATFKKTMSGDDRYSITLSVSEVSGSVNINNNTSQVSYTLTATKSSGSGYYTTNTNNPIKVTLDGVDVVDTKKAYDFTGSTPKTITLASGTRIITHNTDGSKTISCSGYFKDANNSLGKATASGSLTLSTIPRASTINITESYLTLGTAVNIGINRASNSFTDTLSYQFGNASGVIATNITANSYTWTPPLTLAQQIPTETKAYLTITITTYNGGTLVGSSSLIINAVVPSSVIPSVSIGNPTIGGDAPSSWGLFVKGKSTATYSLTGTGNQGSTMVAYKSWVDGYSYDTASVTTNKLTTAGTNIITAYVIDSRGRQSSNVQKTFSVVDYNNPSISVAQIQRCDVNGNIDNNGNYVYVSFNGSVTSLNNNNSNASTYSIKYKLSSASTYSNTIPVASAVQSITKSGMLYTDGIYAANRGSGTKLQLPSSNTYNLQFVISDYFTETTNVQTLDTGFDLLNFNPSGKSMAIGKVSEASASQELLEVALQTNFGEIINANKDIVSSGNITAKRYHTISLTGGNGNTTGYRLIATFDTSNTWTNRRMTFAISSRHTGNGIVAVTCGNNSNTANNTYGKINYWGTTPGFGAVITEDSFQLYKDTATGNTTYLYWKYSDYNTCNITLLSSTGELLSNGTWVETIPSNLTRTSQTSINYAQTAIYDSGNNQINTTYQRKPTILYNNASGTNATITTLSDNVENYSYIEIFYGWTGYGMLSSKYDTSSSEGVNLLATALNNNRIYWAVSKWTPSGTSITLNSGEYWSVNASASVSRNQNNRVYIYKVLGYK